MVKLNYNNFIMNLLGLYGISIIIIFFFYEFSNR